MTAHPRNRFTKRFSEASRQRRLEDEIMSHNQALEDKLSEMQTFLDNTKCLLKSAEKGCMHSRTIPEHHKENQVPAEFHHVFFDDTLEDSQQGSPFKANKSIE